MAAILNGMMQFTFFFKKWDSERLFSQTFDSGQLDHLIDVSERCAAALSSAGFTLSAKHASLLLVELRNARPQGTNRILDGMTLQRAYDRLNRLVTTLPDEASLIQCLLIEPDHVPLYEQSQSLMGDDVESIFADSAYDIAEAGKCLALHRSTAAVFHLMRAMESAERVAGQKLGATVVSQHNETLPWGVILTNMKQKIDVLPKGGEQDDWYKVHALLHSVNRAYRTKTAHPADKYTQEEAHNAFAATKSFMQELGKLC